MAVTSSSDFTFPEVVEAVVVLSADLPAVPEHNYQANDQDELLRYYVTYAVVFMSAFYSFISNMVLDCTSSTAFSMYTPGLRCATDHCN